MTSRELTRLICEPSPRRWHFSVMLACSHIQLPTGPNSFSGFQTLKLSMSQMELCMNICPHPLSILVLLSSHLHKRHHCPPQRSGWNLLSFPYPSHQLLMLPLKSQTPNPLTSLHLHGSYPGSKHPLASRDVPGERGRLSSCIWNLGFFPNEIGRASCRERV